MVSIFEAGMWRERGGKYAGMSGFSNNSIHLPSTEPNESVRLPSTNSISNSPHNPERVGQPDCQNKAQLVMTAHYVDPIELAVWPPAMCLKMKSPYYMIKGKAWLGVLSCVYEKWGQVGIQQDLRCDSAKFIDKYDKYRKKWGGGTMCSKSQAKTKAKERLLTKEAAKKMT